MCGLIDADWNERAGRLCCDRNAGQPIIAHWGVEDPAAFVGTPQARERFFHQVALTLYTRSNVTKLNAG